MNRKTLVKIHMYLAAFFAPFVLMVSLSGGMYLSGVKGSVDKTPVMETQGSALDTKSDSLKADVEALLAEAGISDYSFEYVKVKGDTLYTRPTSREHFIIQQAGGDLSVTRAQPSLQAAMVELHKGHGPTAFKAFQRLFALGLLFVILSGVWLGIQASNLRHSTLVTVASGCVVFLLLLL